MSEVCTGRLQVRRTVCADSSDTARASPLAPALARAVPGRWADLLYLFSLHSWCHQLPGPPGPAWGPAPASSGASLLSSPDSCSCTPCPAGPAAKTQPESSREGDCRGEGVELARTTARGGAEWGVRGAGESISHWETERPRVWKQTCPDSMTRQWQCVQQKRFLDTWKSSGKVHAATPRGPVRHESPGQQPIPLGPAIPQAQQSQGNSSHDVTCPHLQTAPAWGCQAEGTWVQTSRGRPRPAAPWLSEDHKTLSPDRGGTKAEKAEVEQTGGEAGRGEGGAERVSSGENHRGSHLERRSRQQPHIKGDLV